MVSTGKTNATPDRAALSAELTRHLRQLSVDLPQDLDDNSRLISSGLLDSAALFGLLLWIEERTDCAIDPSAIDIPTQLDTIRDIVSFVMQPTDRSEPAGTISDHGARSKASKVTRPNYELVRCDSSHREAVAQFQMELWSSSVTLNEQYFDWKYLASPAASHTRVYLAIAGDEIIGMRSLCGSYWEFGANAQRAKVLLADDLLVRPDLRDTGLVTGFMSDVLADTGGSDIEYALNLTGSPLTVVASLAQGWKRISFAKPIGRDHNLLHNWSSGRAAVEKLPFFWRYAQSSLLMAPAERQPFKRLDQAGPEAIASNDLTVGIASTAPVKRMAALINNLPYEGRIRQVRDADYLAWRFANPLHEYRFLTVGDESLQGYLVLKHAFARGPMDTRVSLVDLEAEDDSIRAALLEVAVMQGQFPHIYAWSTAHTRGDVTRLRELGLAPVDGKLPAHSRPCWLLKSLNETPARDWRWDDQCLLEPVNWDIRMLYAM